MYPILPLVLTLAGVAAAGAFLTLLLCRAHERRLLHEMQNRLAVCDQARLAAVERVQQARTQMGQLSKALADLTEAYRAREQADEAAAAEPDERDTTPFDPYLLNDLEAVPEVGEALPDQPMTPARR